MSTQVTIAPGWKAQLAQTFATPYFASLVDFVKKAYQKERVYPQPKAIFRAFDCCDYDKVKVVILGQDPYHGPGQADGCCFSVPKGIALPPSLCNIFQEISQDLGLPLAQDGDLSRWATQGVLLLNATLTVAHGRAGSHQKIGWERFTDEVVALLAKQKEGLVFLLWGSYAQQKGAFIDQVSHLVLTTSHPSPLAAHRGFLGCAHFSKTNAYLIKQGKQPINW